MSPKDKKAYKRYQDEIKLKQDISKLIEKFSLKYDVSATMVDIRRNEFYGKVEDNNPPMYNMDILWKFDYLMN